MKKGMNTYGIPKNLSTGQAFSMVSEAEFEGIELNMEAAPKENDPLALHIGSSKEQIQEIKTLSEKYNLKITSLTTPMLWSKPMTSNDEKVREEGITAVKLLIDFAADFGADTVLVVPGLVNADTPYDEAYTNALDSIRKLEPHARKNKVNIAIENVWNKFLLSPLEMRSFIDAAESEYVGAYFDIGNAVVNSFPEQWIKILGSRIKKLHAKGFKSSIGNINGFVNILEGDINWSRVMKAVRDIGYNDFLTAEVPPYPQFPMNLLNETSAAFDSIFALL